MFINKRILGVLLVLLVILLVLAPSDVSLGQEVKAVYLHGAITWVAFIIFAVFSLAALAYLITGKQWLFDLASRGHRIGTVYWVANFLIWLPLGVLAWNTAFGDPRSITSVWVMLFLAIGYLVAQIVKSQRVLAIMYTALGLGIWWGFAEVGRMLHPIDPIGTSNSMAIKVFFAAILLTCLGIAVTLLKPVQKRPAV